MIPFFYGDLFLYQRGFNPLLRLSKNLHNFLKWGLGRSPKRGEGGSPTLSSGTDAGRVCPRALQGRKANRAYTALHHGEGVWGFGKDAEIERQRLCRTQSPQSVLIGIENKHFFEKTDFFYNLQREFNPLLLLFYPFLFSFRVFLSSPFQASAFSASEAVYRPPHRPHRIYSGILAVSACLYAFYRNTTS